MVLKKLKLKSVHNGKMNILCQRSKLTFSKSRLLVTFNCKMVDIKNSVAKKAET